VADQLWFITRIREEEKYLPDQSHHLVILLLLTLLLMTASPVSNACPFLSCASDTINTVKSVGNWSSSSSRMRVINHNWSATKQRPHPQSVAEISRHSVLSGDRIRQCETSSGSRHKDTDQCL